MPSSTPEPTVLAEPFAIIHKLWQDSDIALNGAMERYGLKDITPRQLMVMRAIAAFMAEHERKPSQTDLCDMTFIDRSTLADVVRRLQKHSLIRRRRRAEDARAYGVELTDEGKAVVKQAKQVFADAWAEMNDTEKTSGGMIDSLAKAARAVKRAA